MLVAKGPNRDVVAQNGEDTKVMPSEAEHTTAVHGEDVEWGERDTHVLTVEGKTVTIESFTGIWKVVWVESIDAACRFFEEKELPTAFRRIARHLQGREFEFALTKDGRWVEFDFSEKSMFGEKGIEPCPINSEAIDTLAPGGEIVSKRISFEDGKLSISEASKGNREGELVKQEIKLVDDNTLQRRFVNMNTGTFFTVIYSRTGLANHHRTLALGREISAGMPAQHRRCMVFLPAIVFVPVWLFVMTRVKIWRPVFTEFWPMSLAMVLGSFIAGSTPLGGGVVGFPVAVLALGFNAVQGRDFSAMIQSVGMTSASYIIIYLKPQLLDAKLVTYSIVFGVLGCVVGFVVPIDSFAINLTLTTYIAAFAILYFYKNEIVELYAIPVPPTASERKAYAEHMHHRHSLSPHKPPGRGGGPQVVDLPPLPRDSASPEDRLERTRDILLILSALIGGFVTAKLGSGSDSMLYIFASFGWNSMVPKDRRLSESSMTASTVVVMATMSLVVLGVRLATNQLSRDVIYCWAAASPIVSLGGPVGSLILGPAAEIMLRRFFYFIAFVQFLMFAIIVIKNHVVGWSVASAVIALTLAAIFGHYRMRLLPIIRAHGGSGPVRDS